MPQIGDIAKGRNIERTGRQKWIWSACNKCGRERWVLYRKGGPVSLLCFRCGNDTKKGKRVSIATEFKKGEMSGNKHPLWKGGRWRSSRDGYVFIWKPDHPKANPSGYVGEHILVWEESNEMCLPEGYVVHHINGIKDDNRAKNLLALPRRGHSPSLTVKEVQKRLREVEGELAQRLMI